MIDAPNLVSIVGDYTFLVNNWEVTVIILARCEAGYLRGLDVQGFLSVRVDESVTTYFDFDHDE